MLATVARPVKHQSGSCKIDLFIYLLFIYLTYLPVYLSNER